jgi:hypothetical protein
MEIGKVAGIIAAASPVHPLHNKELQKYLVREHGAKLASELLADASGHVALKRRRHLLAFLQRQ